jgi:hypothetical protein
LNEFLRVSSPKSGPVIDWWFQFGIGFLKVEAGWDDRLGILIMAHSKFNLEKVQI